MAPSTSQDTPQAQLQDVELSEQQPQAPASMESQQPTAHQAMNPQAPHADSDTRLRGGEGGGCCPGRFCFCIPCPLPCNCCIIPL
ncbi:hypothetical protein NLU13_0017 [Sarocladium strictum]|uniref:Uncharacterized protein n=1 Tax=Sarocladium strictum TaxID=5046 RepID=A0AA39LAX0_SARSR|nr:hypothetical protein NLU13_0017 [Sarocladium strictum]